MNCDLPDRLTSQEIDRVIDHPNAHDVLQVNQLVYQNDLPECPPEVRVLEIQ